MEQAADLGNPRVYRPSTSARRLFLFSGVLLLTLSVIFLILFCQLLRIWFAVKSGALAPADPVVRFVMLGVIVCAACSMVAAAFRGMQQLLKISRFCVVLSAAGIRLQTPFRSMSLASNQILGRKRTVCSGRRSGTYTVLVPSEAHLPAITISSDFEFDEPFFQWLASIPDLDTPDLPSRIVSALSR